MFDYIKGLVTRTVANYVVIDCNGVGYKIYTPNPYKFKEGEEFTAYVYNHIREDENVLYGFTTEDERELLCPLVSLFQGIEDAITNDICYKAQNAKQLFINNFEKNLGKDENNSNNLLTN